MAKTIAFTLISFALIIGIGWLLLQFFTGDIRGKFNSTKVPKYPNATYWATRGGCDPTGVYGCSTHIYFFTEDNIDQVFDYYKNELPKRDIPFKNDARNNNAARWISFGSGSMNYELHIRSGLHENNAYNYSFSITDSKTWRD